MCELLIKILTSTKMVHDEFFDMWQDLRLKDEDDSRNFYLELIKYG